MRKKCIFASKTTVNMDIETREIAIRNLRPNSGEVEGLPRNPRKISKKNLEKLKKSVQDAPEMLRLRELIVIPHDGEFVVIAGNQRLEAAKAVGMTALPCKVLPADTEPAKLREYAIKDNLPFGEDDWEVIASDWDTAELEEWGMSVPDEWKDTKKAKEDDFDPSQPVETVCKRGDIWQLGDHRLMCGDSTDAASVLLLMDGDKADMVFTDPPYGVSIGDKNKLLKEKVQGGRGNSVTDNIENDTLGTDELYNILVKAMTNVRESCKDDASYYVTSPQGGELCLMMMMMMKNAGLTVRHMLIWCKNSPTFSLGRLDYDYQHEPILYTWTKSHHNYRGGEFRSTIWTYDKPRKCDLHPTMKPVALVANCMKDTTKDGDIILDVFGGSGTTLIAAEQLNRKCYMMELDPHYCDVIIARWEKLTGKKATKVK
jgi:site-specific DNA-methyltransferase (adenine-specific)